MVLESGADQHKPVEVIREELIDLLSEYLSNAEEADSYAGDSQFKYREKHKKYKGVMEEKLSEFRIIFEGLSKAEQEKCIEAMKREVDEHGGGVYFSVFLEDIADLVKVD